MSESLDTDEPERLPDPSAEPDQRDLHDGPRRKKITAKLFLVLFWIAVLAFGVGLILPAIEYTRQLAARTSSTMKLKQMALTMHNYHDTNGTLPPYAMTDKQGNPLLSWRVGIYPFFDSMILPPYSELRLDEPWDSTNNIGLLSKSKMYLLPDGVDAENNEFRTRYRVFYGEGTASGRKLADILDGTANTILTVEAAVAVPWTKPEELEYSPTTPLPNLAGAWSSRGDFLVCMADGSVHMIKKDFSEWDLRAAIVIDDGQIPGTEFFGDSK